MIQVVFHETQWNKQKFFLQFYIVRLSFHSCHLQILRDAVLNFELVQNDLLGFCQNTEKKKQNPLNFFPKSISEKENEN